VRIFNTLTRKKEEFVPLTPGEVRMYVCGVTVYDLSHIGHARSAIVFDVIRRYLLFQDYRVTFVRNFTDVDDRIIRRANTDGVPAHAISERYIREFQADMESLGVGPGDVEPKATEHIPQMVALIERLIAGGFAYVVDGDVYFEVRTFPEYGKLSGKNLDELLAGARVEIDERKRDPRDFALWKSAKPGEPSWPSPWGPGRPGWHIECSAMSMQYLGESFDLHGGGEDLIFPHHECEIAQTEAVTKRPFVKVWVHNAFVNLGAEKMSKSLGNTLAIKDIVKRHDPDALRFWMLGTHYRNPIEWSEDRAQEAASALQRIRNVIRLARNRAYDLGIEAYESEQSLPTQVRVAEVLGRITDQGLRSDVSSSLSRFTSAMDDDFNTPQARAVLFELAQVANGRSDLADKLLMGEGSTDRSLAAIGDFIGAGHVLWLLARCLGLSNRGTDPNPKIAAVQLLVDQREAARKARDWKLADELREQLLHEHNLVVQDRPGGPRLVPRNS
jgi:cysteinyl-tRNA synthetase